MRSMLCRNSPPGVRNRAIVAMLTRKARRSQSSPKGGSDGGASTGPNPSRPPRSCTPSTPAVSYIDDGRDPYHEPVPSPGLIVDRDGTLIEERGYISDLAGVVPLPGVEAALARAREAGV